jgi:hypothetical protein
MAVRALRPNDAAQQSGRPGGRNTLKNRDAGPVCWSGWFGAFI